MPAKQLLLLLNGVSTKILEVNSNRIVFSIRNMDPAAMLTITDGAPSLATHAWPIFPYEQQTFKKVDGERTGRDWWAVMAGDDGYIAILEHMGTPIKRWW